jgi:hypothetical protein
LRFAAAPSPAALRADAAHPFDATRGSLDLTAFAPVVPLVERRWDHVIRRIDHRFRFHLPEGGQVAEGGRLAGRLRLPCWELVPPARSGGGALMMQVDHRDRLYLPAGIRQQLGLHTNAVVSVALDRSRILIWPAASLDHFLEVLQ